MSASWSKEVTQTLPAPTATYPNSLTGTVTSAATWFVAGSIRTTRPASLEPDALRTSSDRIEVGVERDDGHSRRQLGCN